MICRWDCCETPFWIRLCVYRRIKTVSLCVWFRNLLSGIQIHSSSDFVRKVSSPYRSRWCLDIVLCLEKLEWLEHLIIAGVTFPRINSFEIWIWSGVGKLIAPIFFFSGFFTGPKNKVTTKFGRDFVLFMKLVCNLKKKQRRLVIGNSFSWKNEIELNCISISFGLEVNKQQCLK